MPVHPDDVTVVTVTYGYRWDLLRQALASARRGGAARAVVVDNGSEQDIASVAAWEFGKFVHVVTLPVNCGSAGGFKAGMQTALQLGASYLLLLDDDNELQPGCIAQLLAAHRTHAKTVAAADLAVLAFRPDHQADIARGVSSQRANPRANAFFGFHVLDIPYKLWSRIRPHEPMAAPQPTQAQYRLDVAPYSGMLFHASVVQAHGLPNDHLVLYGDDTEFSYRITAAGGEIVLVCDALIKDLEASWNVKRRFSSSFDQWLSGESDLRAFYSARNQAHFECQIRKGRRFAHGINQAVYLAALTLRAVQTKKQKRLALFKEAVQSGKHGVLGIDKRYPL